MHCCAAKSLTKYCFECGNKIACADHDFEHCHCHIDIIWGAVTFLWKVINRVQQHIYNTLARLSEKIEFYILWGCIICIWSGGGWLEITTPAANMYGWWAFDGLVASLTLEDGVRVAVCPSFSVGVYQAKHNAHSVLNGWAPSSPYSHVMPASFSYR